MKFVIHALVSNIFHTQVYYGYKKIFNVNFYDDDSNSYLVLVEYEIIESYGPPDAGSPKKFFGKINKVSYKGSNLPVNNINNYEKIESKIDGKKVIASLSFIDGELSQNLRVNNGKN